MTTPKPTVAPTSTALSLENMLAYFDMHSKGYSQDEKNADADWMIAVMHAGGECIDEVLQIISDKTGTPIFKLKEYMRNEEGRRKRWGEYEDHECLACHGRGHNSEFKRDDFVGNISDVPEEKPFTEVFIATPPQFVSHFVTKTCWKCHGSGRITKKKRTEDTKQ